MYLISEWHGEPGQVFVPDGKLTGLLSVHFLGRPYQSPPRASPVRRNIVIYSDQETLLPL